ncbi:MAG: YcnI family protein [Acidimicrobiales bacterium]
MRTLKTIAGLGAIVGAIVLGASSASAHVTVDPGTATKGAGDQVLTFRVPNEMDDANTTQVKIQLPQDHPIAAVDVLAMPGWTTKVETVHLATPIQTDDGAITDVPSVITWTGGQIKPGEYGEFKVLAMGLPDDTDSLAFHTLQDYDNNQEVSWIDATAAGQAMPEHPAPVLGLTAAAAGDVASPAVGDSSDDSDTLAIVAIIVGGVGLVAAVAAIALARKQTPRLT